MKTRGLLSIAIAPRTGADREKLVRGLAAMAGEDPSVVVNTDVASGDVTIAANSEQHLEIIIDRLKREFLVEAGVGRPRVVCKVTFTRPADGEIKYATRAGGRGQYAHVKIHLFPGEPGTGYSFQNAIVGNAIPPAFIQSIDDGVQDAVARGILSGRVVEDVRIELYDGSYHDVDSSPGAFKVAGSLAFEDAASKAGPVILEPVMRVDVVVSQEYWLDVIRNLQGRRGRGVQSTQVGRLMPTIRALVPLSEMFGYATDLRERTRGSGVFEMQLDHYQPSRRDDDDDGGRDSLAGAPLKPRPTPREGRIALPEPDDDNQVA